LKHLIFLASVLVMPGTAFPQSNVPTFGSAYAGNQYFDREHSDIQPSTVTHCSEDDSKPRGRGRVKVQVVPYVKKEAEGLDWPHDQFHVNVVRDGREERVTDLEASYGTCDVYLIRLDAGPEPAVVIESGEGRGTFTYRRSVSVYKRTEGTYGFVFDANLNGYLPPPQGGDPKAWERAYTFRRSRSGMATIRLRLRLAPEEWPDFGLAQELDALQFPVRDYCWNHEHSSYVLCDYKFTKPK
jgi:hypothetical protein